MFQSLLHQGISLLLAADSKRHGVSVWVSIPSSSGHQFTAPCWRDHPYSGGYSFNPFFIRASVYWTCPPLATARAWRRVSIPSSSGHQFTGMISSPNIAQCATVSIPSSSGHQFTGKSRIRYRGAREAGFQSLLHQGISLLRKMPEISMYR